MNHIYRSIWSDALSIWIAVSENTKGEAKGSSTLNKLAVTGLLLYSATSWALPNGGQVSTGQVSVSTPNTTQMNIQQTSQQATVDWQVFSIAPNEIVNILQPNTGSVLLNRVIGQDASTIQGQLNANGQVFLINPNGVIFSKTSQVNVGSLFVSTHNLSNADFLNGKFHFTQNSGSGSGIVSNQGAIKTSEGGVVALIGTNVTNTGVIQTPKGTTALAAGKTIDLDFKGDGLVEMKVSEAALQAQIDHQGAIQADGGRVILTAKATGQLVGTVLNSQGVIQAQSLVSRNGEIILEGGTAGMTQVTGTLDTSGQQSGGTIRVTGENINISSNANFSAQTLNGGKAGTINILANKNTGTVTIAGRLDASAPQKGDGGFIDTSAAYVKVLDSANISTKAANGNTGTWLIDPLDYTIAASGGDITGAALNANLINTSVKIASISGNTVGSDDINVNDSITWSANKLTFSTGRNININANLTGSGTAQLALEYGQNAGASGNTSNYIIKHDSVRLTSNPSINLSSSSSLSTRLGSDGDIKNYTILTSIDEMQNMNSNLDMNYALGTHIQNAGSTKNWNGGMGFVPVGDSSTPFTGTFTGLGHVIGALNIKRETTDGVGLFGDTSNTATIRNIGLAAGNIQGQNEVGALVGHNSGNIHDVVNIGNLFTGKKLGNVTGVGSVGSLVGYNDGNISKTYAINDVTGSANVGGLIGENKGSISDVYATGDVTGGNSGDIGGLVGSNSGSINNAYAVGNVNTGYRVGGLVGLNNSSGTINNVYATGNVSGSTYKIGGLVGLNYGPISNAYATGNINGTGATYVGGLVGYNSAPISNSFWDIQTTAQNSAVGNESVSTGVSGKTTTDMMKLSTFSPAWGQDISDKGGESTLWRIYEGHSTPLLRGGLVPLIVNADNISGTFNGQEVTALLSYRGDWINRVNTNHLPNLNKPYADAINAGVYRPSLYSDQQGYDITHVDGVLTINPASLDISGTRVYDGTANMDVSLLTLSGFFNNDNLALTGTGIITSKNVGVYNALDLGSLGLKGGTQGLLSNYTLKDGLQAINITPKTLTVSGLFAGNKIYDGTTAAFINKTGVKFDGLILNDVLNVDASGVFPDKNVGDNKEVTLTSHYTGADAGNYNIINQLLTHANITPKDLIVSGITAENKHYDGNTTAIIDTRNVSFGGRILGDLLDINSSGVFTDETIGSDKDVILTNKYTGLDVGNYRIIDQLIAKADIKAKEIEDVEGVEGGVVTKIKEDIDAKSRSETRSELSERIETREERFEHTVYESNDDFGGEVGERLSVHSANNASAFNAALLSDDTKKLIQPTLTIKNSAGRVKQLEMSANKQFLSLLLEDGSVRVWDFQRGVQRQIDTQNIRQSSTNIGRVDNQGELLSIASKVGLGAYDVISSSPDATIQTTDINHFVTSSDGGLVLVNSGANELALWDNKQNKKQWQWSYQRGAINSLALTDNKHYGAVLSNQQGSYMLPANLQLKQLTDAVDIIDIRTGKVIKSLPNLGEQIIYMQFKDNDTLQLGLSSGQVIDWSMASNSHKTVADFAENVTTMDTAGATYSYVLKDGTVRVGNSQGQTQLSIKNKENPFTDARLLEKGKKLLTVMASGDLALWDVASGKKMLRLFSTQQGWTVMDAFGRFDGSEEALENFSWLADKEDIPLDNFSENYYEPGLLASVLQNQDYLNNNPNAVKSGIGLPPKVSLQLAEQQTQNDKVALQLDVYDRGGGINKINLYHNGKLLSPENGVLTQPIPQSKDVEHRLLTLNVIPSAGKNTVKVTASNDMGIENSSTELSFDGKSKAYTSALKVLTVGIDRYSDAKLNLDYSVADADSIGKAIKNTANITAIKNLFNENATKPKILAELKELSQGAQQDVLVVYFAGHGLALGKEWYFLPFETKMQSSLEKVATSGITATELSDIFKNSKIQHILLIVDSCYSGAGMDAFSKLQNGQRYFTRQLSRTLGITVLTATAKDQQAAELKSLGHGLFTYMMIQELQKNRSTNAVTAHGIADIMVKNLPAFSKKMVGTSQEPVAYTHGSDFMLTDVLKKSENTATPKP